MKDKVRIVVEIDKKDYKTLLNAFKNSIKPITLIQMFGENITPYLQYFINNMIQKQKDLEQREKILFNKKDSKELEPKGNTEQLSAEELEEFKRLLGG